MGDRSLWTVWSDQGKALLDLHYTTVVSKSQLSCATRTVIILSVLVQRYVDGMCLAVSFSDTSVGGLLDRLSLEWHSDRRRL